MRLPPLLQGTRRVHSVFTLNFRVAHMSPSSSGAGVRLSLLEGDCVGPTRPILEAGLLGVRLFSFQFFPRARAFHHEKAPRAFFAKFAPPRTNVDSGTGAPHHLFHDHESVRSHSFEKSHPLGGLGSTRAIDFSQLPDLKTPAARWGFLCPVSGQSGDGP